MSMYTEWAMSSFAFYNTKYLWAITKPNRCYVITDGAGDRNIVHLSVQKYLVALIRKYNFDEIIAIRTFSPQSVEIRIKKCRAHQIFWLE